MSSEYIMLLCIVGHYASNKGIVPTTPARRSYGFGYANRCPKTERVMPFLSGKSPLTKATQRFPFSSIMCVNVHSLFAFFNFGMIGTIMSFLDDQCPF